MRDSYEAWDIWSPWDGLLGYTQRTRAATVHLFLSNVSKEVHKEKCGKLNMFDEGGLSALEGRVWREWKRKGFMAVHVIVQAADHRVP